MDEVFPGQAAKWCGGTWHPREPLEPLRALCIDSRRAGPGSLFFALKGERTDGHRFLESVAAAWACAVVRTDLPPDELPDGPGFLRVDDPLAALGRLAAAYRRQMPARIVGITGSVGKTTTKELAADLLATAGKTTRSAANYNNAIGLPLSLSELTRDCAFGVFEAGISHPGDMTVLRAILQPDIAVVTRMGPVHIEHFESVEAIAAEKAALLDGLPAEGLAVLDRDDDCFGLFRGRSSAPVVTCSLVTREADYAGDVQADGRLWVCEAATGETAELPLPPPGGYMAGNVLAAVAVARRCGASWAGIESALGRTKPVGMRWAVEVVRGWTAVNDGYNANPVSMRAALEAFARWPAPGRKFLALGPMLELGALESEAHAALGRRAAEGPWAGAVVVPRTGAAGVDAAADRLAAGLRAGGMAAEHVCRAPGAAAAAAWLRERLRPGDALLLKASRGVRIEDVLTDLKQEG